MDELPPDVPRLRAIQAHLEQQLAANETVGTYLRLQLDAVRKAIARVDGQPSPQRTQPQRPKGNRPAPLTTFTGSRSGNGSTGFVVERQVGAEPARVHTDDCPHPGKTHPISTHDARAALIDPNVTACVFCRPDAELGLDFD
ncbi:DUF6233 domain-containing protein [Streptomyces sp. NBC_00444]|uniref:DUF6233 domain-containing protein n=1 Tax=Streptomyces sp. NBC_00444 TaxID=2975744 RepID=UPI002E215C11